jgi:hypothetical protein
MSNMNSMNEQQEHPQAFGFKSVWFSPSTRAGKCRATVSVLSIVKGLFSGI